METTNIDYDALAEAEVDDSTAPHLAVVPTEDDATYNTLLAIWQASLGPVRDAARRPTLHESAALVGTYPGLLWAGTLLAYSDTLRILEDVLIFIESAVEQAEERKTFALASPAEDVEENYDLYSALTLKFQEIILTEELAIDVTHADAAARFAAVQEVRRILLSQEQGLVRFLNTIGVEFTEETIQAHAIRLNALASGSEEE